MSYIKLTAAERETLRGATKDVSETLGYVFSQQSIDEIKGAGNAQTKP